MKIAPDGAKRNPGTAPEFGGRRGFQPPRKANRISVGFTGCGKTRFGGRRGFQPPHNVNRINVGFSHGGTLSADFTQNPDFFRSLFSPGRTLTSDLPMRSALTDGGFLGGCARIARTQMSDVKFTVGGALEEDASRQFIDAGTLLLAHSFGTRS